MTGELRRLARALLGAPPKTKDYYTSGEFVALVGKAPYTVREWSRQGRLNAERKKDHFHETQEWRIAHKELERYRNWGIRPPLRTPRPGRTRSGSQ